MKNTKIIIALFLLLLPSLANAQKVKDYLKTGNTIKFCKTSFLLGYSSNPTKDLVFQEYFPQGEKPESYNEMFTVSLHYAEATASMAVEAKIKELEERKKTDACCNYKVYKNGDEFILDFLVSAKDPENPECLSVAEHDLHYYKQVTINGKKGIQLLFYSHRAYGDDIIPFIKKIPETNEKNILELTKMRINFK